MQIIHDLTQFPRSFSYPIMTIGVFDGVHGGHQVILEQLVKRAGEKKGTSILLTFSPHPQKIISPEDAPLLLQTELQKEKILEKFDLSLIVCLPFTRELSLYTPADFARQILHNHGIREIHVGSNFRFGHRRAGDIETLRSLGEEFQFEVCEIEPVYFRGTRISSSYIRDLLRQGRVVLAKRLLKRPYQIQGLVVRGSGKGVELGFPTANLELENELIPANGVYATRVHLDGQIYPSVTNVGHRPTLHEGTSGAPVVEPHLLDFHEDIYGRQMKLDFCFRLRAEKKFESIGKLQEQIARDAGEARKYFQRIKERGLGGNSAH
jgi:riboflavin kinase/FMN adenylyltransferase